MTFVKTLAIAAVLASLAVPMAATGTFAGSKTDKAFAVATTISKTAKTAVAVAKVVAPKNPVVKLVDANIKIYSNVGCQLGKLIYGSGC